MKRPLIALILSTGAIAAQGLPLRINVHNEFVGLSNPLKDENGNVLSGGELVVFGYFEIADSPISGGIPFENFTPISSIVLQLASDGTFSDSIQLDSSIDTPGTSNSILQYGLRFFNNTTQGNSTYHNTVTTSDWQFAFSNFTPPPPDSEMFLDPLLGTPNAIWEGGAASAFLTTVPVPEPSSIVTILLGATFFIGSRKRR